MGDILKLAETIIDDLTDTAYNLDFIFETILNQNERIKELEANVQILRETIDTLNQNR